MMMGYYDINGYAGGNYENLVPGDTAETQTYSGTTGWASLANNIIASSGHVTDFYNSGTDIRTPDPGDGPYLDAGDDLLGPHHSFNCLADFMGTSQDSVGNPNGSTNFWFWTDGSRMTEADIYGLGSSYYNSDGMYGIGEYVSYAGYDTSSLYTQLTDNDEFGYGFTGGFSFTDYQNEINAGRVVMLHVKGHSMFGYGYGDNDTVYLCDTWSLGPHTMTWGGSYSGLDMWGVTTLTLVPVPAAFMLGILGLGVVGIRMRKYA